MNEATCGCCEGTEKITPQSIANRPGLAALAYRMGTHSTFLETMKACLSSGEFPALSDLTTRAASDPSIAFLDAGATLLDVLTFYQERIANEGYLRTATERRSILELARLVGYELRPGVAASVFLAFTLDDGYETEIPTGTRAQSIPEPGETMQSFETSEPLLARTEWNLLQPRLTKPQDITLSNAAGLETLYFKGTSTNLGPNDPLLLVFDTSPDAQILHRINQVEADIEKDHTVVTLAEAARVRAETLRTTLEVVNKYLALEAFGVSEETQMAKRVTEFLQGFKRRLVPGLGTVELAFMFDKLLPDLRDELAIAEEGEYARLEPWVSEMVSELETVEATVKGGEIDRTGFRSLVDETSLDEKRASPLSSLEKLIPQLLLPPSSQPLNAQRLPRNYKSLFSKKADTLPRLLTNFQPKLKDALYQAWGNVQAARNTTLDDIHALRVKAAPFGHNAPRRVIQNEDGVVVGQEEWPLVDARQLGIEIGLPTSPEVIASAPGTEAESHAALFSMSALVEQIRYGIHFTNLMGGKIYQKLVPFAEQTIQLGDLKIIIATSDSDDSLEFSFTNLKSGNTIREVLITSDDDGLTFTFDGQPVPLAFGEVIQVELNDHRLTLAYGVGGEGQKTSGTLLSIKDEFPPENRNILTLDAEYSRITPDSWVAIQRGDDGETQIFQISQVKTVTLAAYGISGKATELTLKGGDWLKATDWTADILRATTVFAQSEPLELAEEPITAYIAGDTIELGPLYDGLESGRWVIVSGERMDIKDEFGNPVPEMIDSERVMLAGVENDVDRNLPGDKMHTILKLANSLAYTYKRETVKLYGNVVKATHGETREEVLGSGNTSQAFQTFTLKQAPLTFISATTPSGVESTLEVRVNDVRWPEAEALIWLDANERGYETKANDEAKTSVIFGDGEHGTRLPTGPENVKAVYRSGIGKPGNVAAEQISVLATKPLGVKSVINPLRASGGADREDRDQARRNTPLAVMSLDRLVSVQDYADFARTFAGIGKASAIRLSDGRRELVHVTIAGADDIPVDDTSDLFINLRQALHKFGDPSQPIQLATRELQLLVIVARVRLLPDYLWEAVEPEIRTTMLDTFSFARRELGQDVVSSQVIRTLQQVPGVAYVDLDVLDAVAEDSDLSDLENLAKTLKLLHRIPVEMARVDLDIITPPHPILKAQLAYLSPEIPDTLILSELT